MPAQLLSLTEGPSVLLDKPIVLVGRHDECDLQLNSRKVSRKHCCIAQVKDYLVVRDLGSTNGVRINGERVAEGVLRTGDELTIGNYRYQVHTELPREIAVSPPGGAAPARPALLVSDDELESMDVPVPIKERDGAPSPAGHAQTTAASEAAISLSENLRRAQQAAAKNPPS